MTTIEIHPGAGWLHPDESHNLDVRHIGHGHQTSGGIMIQNYSMLWGENRIHGPEECLTLEAADLLPGALR